MLHILNLLIIILPGFILRLIGRMFYIIWNLKDKPEIMYFYRNKYETMIFEDYKLNYRTYKCKRFVYKDWLDYFIDDDSKALESRDHQYSGEIKETL